MRHLCLLVAVLCTVVHSKPASAASGLLYEPSLVSFDAAERARIADFERNVPGSYRTTAGMLTHSRVLYDDSGALFAFMSGGVSASASRSSAMDDAERRGVAAGENVEYEVKTPPPAPGSMTSIRVAMGSAESFRSFITGADRPYTGKVDFFEIDVTLGLGMFTTAIIPESLYFTPFLGLRFAEWKVLGQAPDGTNAGTKFGTLAVPVGVAFDYRLAGNIGIGARVSCDPLSAIARALSDYRDLWSLDAAVQVAYRLGVLTVLASASINTLATEVSANSRQVTWPELAVGVGLGF